MWHLARVALLGVCWVIAMSKVGGTRYQVQFFRLEKLNCIIAYCCTRSTYVNVRSCFRHLLLLLLFYCCCCCCCCYCKLASAAASSAAAAAAAIALRTAGWSCSVFFFFFQLSCESYMVMDVVVQNPQKSSGYDQGTTMRKKHVNRDSKMCCCCCRFCCGAPTTDERIHAPVLHDASQIDYCRY